MNSTTGLEKTFLDSNILIYLIDKDEAKKAKVESLLNPQFVISTQVIAENVNACLKKLKLPQEKSFHHGNFLLTHFQVIPVAARFFPIAFELALTYQFSFWDSLIVASALESECEILFSEDMHDGLRVKGKLTILNPFKLTN